MCFLQFFTLQNNRLLRGSKVAFLRDTISFLKTGVTTSDWNNILIVNSSHKFYELLPPSSPPLQFLSLFYQFIFIFIPSFLESQLVSTMALFQFKKAGGQGCLFQFCYYFDKFFVAELLRLIEFGNGMVCQKQSALISFIQCPDSLKYLKLPTTKS